jgi:hypothetical protein
VTVTDTQFVLEVDDEIEEDDGDECIHPELRGVVFGDEIRNPFTAQDDFIKF